jgi:Ulp1 family protease
LNEDSTPLPPLLLPPLVDKFNPKLVQDITNLWVKGGEYCVVNGVSFGIGELKRLLHVQGAEAYMNDSILDVCAFSFNEACGDSWVFQAHLVEKYNSGDGFERWINRSIKRWEKKWGKNHFPKYVLIPFAVGLHYRLYVWDTHRDRVQYVEPFSPSTSADDEQFGVQGVQLCAEIRKIFSGMTVPPPEYGLQLPQFPAQQDSCSCGLYVILYVFMVSQNVDEVYFPKEGTDVFRMWLAKKLTGGEFGMSSMAKFFRAKKLTDS